MHTVLFGLQVIIFVFLGIQVMYLLFFSIMGRVAGNPAIPPAARLRSIRIFIPGYKEDAVIIETAAHALLQNYPAALFEVVVIADSFEVGTLEGLYRLGVRVVEVSFDKSTKGKALQKAIEATASRPVDIVLVLDADNHMARGFLHAVNNAFEAGYEVAQGHRTAKNLDTSFSFLDACTEEINNHIFRRGHVAAGLPSALIGSGMAFNWDLFVSLLQDIGDTAGEDKELEFRLVRMKKNIAFLDGHYVYDEKVARKEVFSNQRSRWLAAQLEFLQKYFVEGWLQLLRGNIPFFNKVFQTFLLPRVMLVALSLVWFVAVLFFGPTWIYPSTILVLSLVAALLLGIPWRWYNKQLFNSFLQIPVALMAMVKALLKIGNAKGQFIHTPHGEVELKKQ